MPTATRLTTNLKTPIKASNSIPLNASTDPEVGSPSQGSSTEATLRSLYNRAAPSFLHRNFFLTESLLNSAFALLPPPTSSPKDALSSHRRKWDVLRITLETTAYTSPPPDKASYPPGLRENMTKTPHTFLNSLYDRSLHLFTSLSSPQQPNPAYLPSQVLITLVLSAMKLEASDVGRGMIEDWLARRGQVEEVLDDQEGYEKVIEIYCCEVLPRLEQWDYAKEFLQYESLMGMEKREHLANTLESLHQRHLESRRLPQVPSPIGTEDQTPAPVDRSPSPTSSSSSDLSATSTHTVVPLPSKSRSTTSPASSATATALAHPSLTHANGSARVHSPSQLPRSPHIGSTSHNTHAQTPPSLPAIIRATIGRYMSMSRLATVFLLFVVLPLLSILLRLRRRRRLLAAGAGGSIAASVQRRLVGTEGKSLVGKVWSELVRAVVDAIKMGGSGLA